MKPFNEENPKMNVTINNGDWAMHGDVLLFGEESLPIDFDSMPKVQDHCLAHGEATGHHHKLVSGDFDLRECPKTKVKYLKVVTPTMLKHQEHSPIEINPGIFRIGIQREYDPFAKKIREVAD
jgi:hypothetical protein